MMSSFHIFHALSVLFLCLVAVTASLYPPDEVDILAVDGLKKLAAYQAKYNPNSKCTVQNAIKRREW